MEMDLSFCVLTMVTRDDLPDGGAAHVAATIKALKEARPGIGVEVLISDLSRSAKALETVLKAGPEVLNHNLETVARLYPRVRPQADYRASLELLSRAGRHRPRPVTKSGLMLGLGETREEILKVLDDLRATGCDLVTLGQYLAPSPDHHPIIRYVTPEEFEEFRSQALARGFKGVASAPLVRSSYQAGELCRSAKG
jgi:lipoic acid synthetase